MSTEILNKKEDNPEGIVSTKKSKLRNHRLLSIKIMYRDAAYVDGDLIRVFQMSSFKPSEF
jgi:hypothetical protein